MEDIKKTAKSKQEIRKIMGMYSNKFWGSHSCNDEDFGLQGHDTRQTGTQLPTSGGACCLQPHGCPRKVEYHETKAQKCHYLSTNLNIITFQMNANFKTERGDLLSIHWYKIETIPGHWISLYVCVCLYTGCPKSHFTKIKKYLTVIIFTCIQYFICNSWQQRTWCTIIWKIFEPPFCHFLLVVYCKWSSISQDCEYSLGEATFRCTFLNNAVAA